MEAMKTTVERSGPDRSEVERRRWSTDSLVRVDYKRWTSFFSEFARNINEGGLFVETDSPPPLGASVSLQFQIPGSDELDPGDGPRRAGLSGRPPRRPWHGKSSSRTRPPSRAT